MKGMFPRFSITKKIAFGYSIAIGIAIGGTLLGLEIGDYYHRKAHHQLQVAQKRQYLLINLENAVLEMRSHPADLFTVLSNSIWFDYETAKFYAQVNRIHTLLESLTNFPKNTGEPSGTNSAAMTDLLEAYESATNAYIKQVELMWDKVNPRELSAAEITAAEQQLLALRKSDRLGALRVTFERLSEQLSKRVAAAENEEKIATAKLQKANWLRMEIILGSMGLSAAIAVLVGLYTSRAIARPIRWVSEVAQQVTQQANFKLVAPVLTDDEVGALATSLNQMIRWMGQYTHQLELSRENLEQRVEERTRELRDALQELQQTQTQLIQSEKMSSLGQMVAGIAHEINNPANFIYGNIAPAEAYIADLLNLLELYQQEYPNPSPEIQQEIEIIELEFLREDLPKLLQSMKIGSDRIRQIVLSLRNFSRLDESVVKKVDIHEGIDSTLLILQSKLKKDIEVIKNYQPIPAIECYPAQLNQVFMNIIGNAIDALSEQTNSTKQITVATEIVDNFRIQVTIADNGPGIPKEIQDKLFDPFFTTKPVGKGTGLGLSIAYQIVEKHQGTIQVISAPGQGTKFAIALPIEIPKRRRESDAA